MKRTARIIIAGLLGLTLVGGITAYLVVWAPATTEYIEARSLWIAPGDHMDAVADSLEARKILIGSGGFVALAKFTGWGDQIKAGHYLIDSGVSNIDILQKLRKGLQEPVNVYVPAGTRRERVARSISTNMAFSEADARAAMADSALAMELGTDTTNLLGYMLPNTYRFYWLTDAADVIRKVKAEADIVLKQARPADEKRPLSDQDVLILASIVEWETNHVPEKATIAGVYLNRIRDRWRLDADPTVQYMVLMMEGDKRRLYFSDYRRQHPYNTYRFRGLPPGPVTNPSASSIEAVLNPEDHSYYFFVSTGNGSHLFSSSLAEHNRRAREYRATMDKRRAARAREVAATNQQGF
ncbi:MAG: endolytic transglycosylase MltG [Bacteroidetes bacterium]|nr:MAG: endolytic transglycosylase MltG [Bacteroidota bacterium]